MIYLFFFNNLLPKNRILNAVIISSDMKKKKHIVFEELNWLFEQDVEINDPH